jgi:hypothetical protein
MQEQGERWIRREKSEGDGGAGGCEARETEICGEVSRWTEGGRRQGKGAGGGGHIYIGVVWMRRRRRTAPLLGRTGVAKVWDRKRALALSANQIRTQNRREGEEGVAKG